MRDEEQPPPFPKLTPIDPTAPDTRDYAEIEAQLAAMLAEHQPLVDEYKKLEMQARAADVGLIEPRPRPRLVKLLRPALLTPATRPRRKKQQAHTTELSNKS